MLLLGYILVICHKNNIVTLHVTFMLYRRNKMCLVGYDILSMVIITTLSTSILLCNFYYIIL